MKAQTKVTIMIVPTSGNAEQEGADADDDRVEGRDDRHAGEVALEGDDHVARDRPGDGLRHAEMPFDARRRSDGPSLSRKKRLSIVKERPRTSEVMPLMPGRDAVDEGLNGVRRRRLRRLGRARGARGVDADILQPGGDLVSGRRERRRDVSRLGADPADHEQGDQHGEPEEPQNDDRGASCPSDAVSGEPAHERCRDAGEQEGDDDGPGDLGGRAQQPDETDEEQDGTDAEPRCDPEVAEPARCGEDAGELLELCPGRARSPGRPGSPARARRCRTARGATGSCLHPFLAVVLGRVGRGGGVPAVGAPPWANDATDALLPRRSRSPEPRPEDATRTRSRSARRAGRR